MASTSSINLISFNLHGYNQGIHVVGDLISDFNYPDIILVQEHWLTPDNIAKLNCFEGYFAFATSAMLSSVEKGPLYGRPFGGVGFIINESHRSHCKLVCSSDRFIAVTLYDLLIINVYLPCDGTPDRLSLYRIVLEDVWHCREKFIDYNCVVAGDFNVDFSNMKGETDFVADFIADRKLFNCYDIYRGRNFVSYFNEALGHVGLLDYFFVSNSSQVLDINVIDPDVNFSDHLPVMLTVCIQHNPATVDSYVSHSHCNITKLTTLRWAHADILSYNIITTLDFELGPLLARAAFLYDNRHLISRSEATVAGDIDRYTI